jgi:hypothetical protein
MEIEKREKIEPASFSMWLSLAFLVSKEEFRALLEEIVPFYIIKSDALLNKEEGILSLEALIAVYDRYLDGGLSLDKESQFLFQSVWTASLETVYQIEIGAHRAILKIAKPSIIATPYKILYSKEEERFFPMILNKEAHSLGLQLSYPQLYLDPKSRELNKVLLNDFVNNAFFKKIRAWFRKHTYPLQVEIEGIKKVMPLRVTESVKPIISKMKWIEEAKIRLL